MDELLTITEAAELLGVHTETLRRWDRENKLTAVKINDRGDRRYKKSDLESFMNGGDLLIEEYLGYKVYWRGTGFVSMAMRFAVIGKIYVTRDAEFIGFAFIAAGLALFSDTEKKDSLEAIAVNKAKEYIKKGKAYNGDIFTFEYMNRDFVEVQNPEWWDERYRRVLVEGIRVIASSSHPTTMEQKAWRVILNYQIESNGSWYTRTFGSDSQHAEYFVFIDSKELARSGLGNTAKDAEIYALKFGIKRFEETKDANGDRSVEKILENKVACFDNTCIKNADLPDNLLK